MTLLENYLFLFCFVFFKCWFSCFYFLQKKDKEGQTAAGMKRVQKNCRMQNVNYFKFFNLYTVLLLNWNKHWCKYLCNFTSVAVHPSNAFTARVVVPTSPNTSSSSSSTRGSLRRPTVSPVFPGSLHPGAVHEASWRSVASAWAWKYIDCPHTYRQTNHQLTETFTLYTAYLCFWVFSLSFSLKVKVRKMTSYSWFLICIFNKNNVTFHEHTFELNTDFKCSPRPL